MSEVFQRIPDPEIFIGIVSPIGTNVDEPINFVTEALVSFGYDVRIIKVTDIFETLSSEIPKLPELNSKNKHKRYETYIKFGDALREYFDDDAILSSLAIGKIAQERSSVLKERESKIQSRSDICQRVAYIVRQFKRKEETDRLRAVYERLFFQISIYSQRPRRVDNLSKTIASSFYSGTPNDYRSLAEELVKTDEDEADNEHGQKLSDVFHDADAIINADEAPGDIKLQVERLVHLMFGSNRISPNKYEYGMYAAKSASLRSVDLSRQIGAAIFNEQGDIITMGVNDVHKAGGGVYWCDDPFDARDFTTNEDKNYKRKVEILSEIIQILRPNEDISLFLSSEKIIYSQFMDALEYGRMVHAEMSAICDAARLGLKLKGTTLFCTTFPCHMCAKHIVASGISHVYFLEPYPKSLANELNGDSLSIDGQYRGDYQAFNSTDFHHFYGVSPRRYRELFERKKRKGPDGLFQQWQKGQPQFIIDIYIPNYLQNEANIILLAEDALRKANANPRKIFDEISPLSESVLKHFDTKELLSLRPAQNRSRQGARDDRKAKLVDSLPAKPPSPDARKGRAQRKGPPPRLPRG